MRVFSMTKLTDRSTRDKRFTEHEGPYGEACINTGQFDAGECWKCQIRRLQTEAINLKAEIATLEAELEIRELEIEGDAYAETFKE